MAKMCICPILQQSSIHPEHFLPIFLPRHHSTTASACILGNESLLQDGEVIWKATRLVASRNKPQRPPSFFQQAFWTHRLTWHVFHGRNCLGKLLAYRDAKCV